MLNEERSQVEEH